MRSADPVHDAAMRRSEVVRVEMIRRATLASRAIMLIGPPSALALAMFMTGTPLANRVWFLVLEIGTAAACVVVLTRLLHDLQRPSRDAPSTVPAVISLGFAAASWPAAFLILTPRSEGNTYLILVFCIAASAISMPGTAAYRPYFITLATTNLLPTALIVASDMLDGVVPRGLAMLVVTFTAALYVAHDVVNRMIMEAVGGRLVEQGLSEQLSEANARLVHRATHDDLTGLANRALFRDVLERRLAAERDGGTGLALLYLDLDRFKIVNDSLGHAEGDSLLMAAAERLRRCVRGDDLLARVGGDEFTLVAPETDAAAALHLAERIRSEFDSEFVIAGVRTFVTVSIGVTMAAHGVTSTDMMRYADAALYAAKDGGRNRVAMFDEAMRDAVSGQLERETELRDALAAREFEAWYQPIVDPRTRRIVSVEALARWRKPGSSVLPPGVFLPVLAEAGLTTELDDAIGRQARSLRLRIAPHVDDSFRVFTNVSAGVEPLELLIERHVVAAEASGVPLSGLGLEITEQAVVADPAAASAALVIAREQGLAVVLDDVGTGFSSLSLIRTLPLDGLKIDGSFVRGMSHDRRDAAVVASVAALGRRLGLHVTAEGVEREEELEAVLAEGVSTAQGFLFSAAVEAETLMAWLRDGPPWATHPVADVRSR